MLTLPSLETHFGKGPILYIELRRQWTSPTTLDLPYVFLSILSLSSHCIQLMYTIRIVVSQLQYDEWLTMVMAMTLY